MDPSVRAADVLTRLAVVADRLAVEPQALWAELPRLGTAPGMYARVWLATTGDQLALRCRAADGVPAILALPRPGDLSIELASVPDQPVVAETVLSSGSRTVADDLAVLAAADITAGPREELARRLLAVGGRCDLLGRRTEAGYTTWTAGVTCGGTLPEVMAVLPALGQLALELDVPPAQRRLLEQAHLALGAPGGFSIAFSCDAADALPTLTLEYRAIAWAQAVGLADALRPGAPCGPHLGILAGAFAADAASALELTFRGGEPATIRVGVDLGTPAAIGPARG